MKPVLGCLLVCLTCLSACWGKNGITFSFFNSRPTCPPGPYDVSPSSGYRISTNGRIIKKLNPYFFGFNFESVGVLRSLYDSKTKSISPQIIPYLSAFPGAVYRYPGGNISNFYNYSKASSPPYLSPDGKNVYRLVWFTFNDYMRFVTQVHGGAWLVANLYGSLPRHQEPISRLETLARRWAAKAVRDQRHGLPLIMRWELGNELDRNNVKWNDRIYSSRASAIAAAIRSVDPESKFVAMLEDVPAHQWTTPFAYNAHTVKTLVPYKPGYAQHLYYDGFPGQSVPNRVKYLCRDIHAVADAGEPNAGIWITETAVRPPVPWQGINWNKVEWQTKNLSSTISEADMRIALTQFPQVKGAFLHALDATGPWATFYRDARGVLRPTLPYWGMRLFRQTMQDEVLATYTRSRNISGYGGGYDLRAAILTNRVGNHFTIWMTNRASKTILVDLQMPFLAGESFTATLTSLSSPDARAVDGPGQDHVRPLSTSFTLHFNRVGIVNISVVGNSVSALTFGKL